MKKLLTMLLTLMMMLTAFAATAEVDGETLDMDHDTAMIWLDDDMYYFELGSVYEEDGIIFAFFSDSSSGYEFGLAVDNDLGADFYEASGSSEDIYAMIVCEPNGTQHYASCSTNAYSSGYGCDLYMTAYAENGWYQGLMIGYTASDETGETFELVGAFDFMLDSAPASSSAAMTTGASTSASNDYCSVCNGSGMCTHCDFGYCEYCCYGDRECYCGFGDCSVCSGMGYFSYYDYEYGTEYRDCTACGGTGMHDYCNGTGFLSCGVCNGTGECNICYGSGECSYCYGTGRN